MTRMFCAAEHPLWPFLLSLTVLNPVSEPSQPQSPPIWLIAAVSLLSQALTQTIHASLPSSPAINPSSYKNRKKHIPNTKKPSSTEILVQLKIRWITELPKKTWDDQKYAQICEHMQTYTNFLAAAATIVSSEILQN